MQSEEENQYKVTKPQLEVRILFIVISDRLTNVGGVKLPLMKVMKVCNESLSGNETTNDGNEGGNDCSLMKK